MRIETFGESPNVGNVPLGLTRCTIVQRKNFNCKLLSLAVQQSDGLRLNAIDTAALVFLCEVLQNVFHDSLNVLPGNGPFIGLMSLLFSGLGLRD